MAVMLWVLLALGMLAALPVALDRLSPATLQKGVKVGGYGEEGCEGGWQRCRRAMACSLRLSTLSKDQQCRGRSKVAIHQEGACCGCLVLPPRVAALYYRLGLPFCRVGLARVALRRPNP